MDIRNPKRNWRGWLDVEIEHPDWGWIDSTVLPTDDLYGRIEAGEFGPVAPFNPPAAEMRKLYERAARDVIQQRLAEHDYDSQGQLAAYANVAGPYQSEAQNLQGWIVGVWAAWEGLADEDMTPFGADAWAQGL